MTKGDSVEKNFVAFGRGRGIAPNNRVRTASELHATACNRIGTASASRAPNVGKGYAAVRLRLLRLGPLKKVVDGRDSRFQRGPAMTMG